MAGASNDRVASYGAFLGVVNDAVTAYKNGSMPTEAEPPGGGQGRRTSMLLEEVLDQLQGVTEQLEQVGRVSRSDVVQMLRDRVAELERELGRMAEVPKLGDLRAELLAAATGAGEQLSGTIGEQAVQVSRIADDLDGRIAARLDMTLNALQESIEARLSEQLETMAEGLSAQVDARIASLAAATAKVNREQLEARLTRMEAAIAEGMEHTATTLTALDGSLSTAAQFTDVQRTVLDELNQQVEALRLTVGEDLRSVLTEGLDQVSAQATIASERSASTQAAMAAEIAGLLEAVRDVTGERITAATGELASKVDALTATTGEHQAAITTGQAATQQVVDDCMAALAGALDDKLGSLAEQIEEQIAVVASELTERADEGQQLQAQAAADLSTLLADRVEEVAGQLRIATEQFRSEVSTMDARHRQEALDQNERLAERLSGSMADQSEKVVNALREQVGHLDATTAKMARQVVQLNEQDGKDRATAIIERLESLESSLLASLQAGAQARAQGLRSLSQGLFERVDKSGEVVVTAIEGMDAAMRTNRDDVADELKRMSRQLTQGLDEASAASSRLERAMEDHQGALVSNLANELDRRLGFDDSVEHVVNAALARLTDGPLQRLKADIAGVGTAAHRVADAQAAIGKATEDLRHDNVEMSNAMRELRKVVAAAHTRIDAIHASQAKVSELADRIWSTQADLRMALEALPVGSTQRAEMNALVSEVAAVSQGLAQQQSWLHDFSDQVLRLADQVRLATTRPGGPPTQTAASPPPSTGNA